MTEPSAADMPHARPSLGPVIFALWGQAESRRLREELEMLGIPVLLLKGPDLQQRLYGTPAAYMSGDVDVLIPRWEAQRARRTLEAAGWKFDTENGVLWKLSAAATFERSGFSADVHWGLHAAHLPAWSFRRLEDALWHGAERGQSGFLEPDPETLLVFLAVHVVGHGFARPEWQENVRRAADLVADWSRVWRIARVAHVSRAVQAALGSQEEGVTLPVLDGVAGRAVWYATFVLRGHILPKRFRSRIRETLGQRR